MGVGEVYLVQGDSNPSGHDTNQDSLCSPSKHTLSTQRGTGREQERQGSRGPSRRGRESTPPRKKDTKNRQGVTMISKTSKED